MEIHEKGDMHHIDLANSTNNENDYYLKIKAAEHHSLDELKSLLAKYGVAVRKENDLVIIS